jgi:GNAT superfamily N-acetyltransferase/RimJ/RimL family protein N-acetyltransferase
MHEQLDVVTLKSDERMRMVRVTAPDEEFKDRVLPFLGHKGEPWERPMRLALDGDPSIADLSTYFYLGLLGETVVGNITHVEKLERPVGILQHVFTPPEQRRKGICTALMRACTQDFLGRGGRALHLGTEYDTPPYHIYRSFGFEGLGETGWMQWLPEEGFEASFFAPSPVRARELTWGDWPLTHALTVVRDGWILRSIEFHLYGPAGFEAEYLEMQQRLQQGRIVAAPCIEAASGAAVGFATLTRQPQWHFDTLLLDLFVHPSFYDQAHALLAALPEREEKVQCFVDAEATAKAEALQTAGFEKEAALRRQIRWDGGEVDVDVYAKY